MCIDNHGHAVRCRECGDTGEFEALSGDTGPCSCPAGRERAAALAIAANKRRRNGITYSVPFATFCDVTCEHGRSGRCRCAMRRKYAICPNECDPDTRRSCREGWGEGAE